MCRLLPHLTRPSPKLRRVGVRIATFEACSSFTRVTARRIARPPKAAFVTRLRPSRLPDQAARQLPDLTDNFPGGIFLHWCSAPSGRTKFFRLYTLSISEWTFLAAAGLIQSASLLGR